MAAPKAAKAGRALAVPRDNSAEAAPVSDVATYSASSLLEVCPLLRGAATLPIAIAPPPDGSAIIFELDLADVRGQPHARRALEIAAAGRHYLLFVRPDIGKTMLAYRL